uniref:Integrase catalytic domain-containing protein n=1 Tax=Strongyloides venezuelensis TaxID=75913 RepID=A0A0K0EX90_STRVS
MHTDIVLVGAFGNETIPVGKVNMKVCYDNLKHFIDILIVSQLNYDMILGINEIKLFNMLNTPSEYFTAEIENKILNKGEFDKSYLNSRVVNATSELEVSNKYILEEIKKTYPQVDKVLSEHSNDNKSAVNILNSGITDDERFLSCKNYIADTLSRDVQHNVERKVLLGREGESKENEEYETSINNIFVKKNRGRPKKIIRKNNFNLDDEINNNEINLTLNQKVFIQNLHEKGHFCYQKIFHLLNDKFGENKIKLARKDLRKVIKECKGCLKVNIGRSKKKGITMKVTGPRAVMNLDIAGPFMNQTGIAKGKKRYFISLVDHYSKNIFARFINTLKSNKISEEIAKIIKDIQPIVIKCDNAKYFSQIEFKLKVELIKLMDCSEISTMDKEIKIDAERLKKEKIIDIIMGNENLRNKIFSKLRFKKIVYGSPYHSKSNGNVERTRLVTQEDLNIISEQYNNSYHSGIRNTPNKLFNESDGGCVMEEAEIIDIIDGEIYVKKKPFLIKKLGERYEKIEKETRSIEHVKFPNGNPPSYKKKRNFQNKNGSEEESSFEGREGECNPDGFLGALSGSRGLIL